MTLALAIVIILLGLPMVIMGAQLAMLGGSDYYVICGIVVVAAGVLILMSRLLGAFLYLAALAGTWLWAFYEVGVDPVGLLPRVFGPTILGILVVCAIPVLRRMEARRTTVGGAI